MGCAYLAILNNAHVHTLGKIDFVGILLFLFKEEEGLPAPAEASAPPKVAKLEVNAATATATATTLEELLENVESVTSAPAGLLLLDITENVVFSPLFGVAERLVGLRDGNEMALRAVLLVRLALDLVRMVLEAELAEGLSDKWKLVSNK